MNGLEHGLDIDRTRNGKYTFHRCGDCKGPVIRHRPEKCISAVGLYDDKIVERFENNIMMIDGSSGIINKCIDRKGVKKEPGNWKERLS